MRENRTYGSEGGEPVMGTPLPLSTHSPMFSQDFVIIKWILY